MKPELIFEDLGYGRYPPDRWFPKIHQDRVAFMEQLQQRWDALFMEIAMSYRVYLSDPNSASNEDFEAFVAELVRALALSEDKYGPPDWEIHLHQKYQRGNQ